MELLEMVSVALAKDISEKCPFKPSEEGVSQETAEGIPDDDREEVGAEQQNDGGLLGQNLANKSPGESGTIGGPYPPDDFLVKSEAQDTSRGGVKLLVPATDDVEERAFHVTEAAHHLIPGNASLGKSDIYDYLGPAGTGELKQDGEVRQRVDVKAVKPGGKPAEGRTVAIKKMIGYNINGSHNGVWLPGSYAIRRYKKYKEGERLNTSPVGGPKGGRSWGRLGIAYDDWKLHYVAAAIKVSGKQFHDTHVTYSKKVLGVLNKMAAMLSSHLLTDCDDCKGKPEVPPPFVIKQRLYCISRELRGQVSSPYTQWQAPWFTSDHWGDIIFDKRTHYDQFAEAWKAAEKVT